ncbi:MAG: phosphatidylserine/phosphatidylglycerophosphate/cardiolipin synthase family protein [Peptococcaceae bacterium]|nr:phosphatidylserine/phosphatidylglycerophosphate/cardiolipin synthase family protein [Peptococcaceae bacterium]
MKYGKHRFVLISILIILIVTVSGCGIILPFAKDKAPDRVSDLSAGSIFIDANEIRSQTIALLNNAQRAIFIELSALDDPEIIDLIINRSHQGVEVRILLDQWQRENAQTVKNLKNQNISVQYYPAQKGQYHRLRYMVIDYQVAVFYGQDWLQKFANTHTLAIKLTGNTAWSLAKSFAKDWQYTTTLALELPETINLPEDNISLALNGKVKQQILYAINQSTTDIYAEVEQISETETVQALIAAKQRGCRVRLLLSPSCAEGTPNTIKALKEAQIEVRYFKSTDNKTMNFNVGVFDNKTLIMSNSSWSYNTFVINHEGSLSIPSPHAVNKINSVFEQDWENSTPA